MGEPGRTIERIGFRRWYERQLIEGHAWLITCLLSLVAFAACLEGFPFRAAPAQLLTYAAVAFLAGVVGIYALLRYRDILARAEQLADHSTCPGCGLYGRYRVIGAPLLVRCSRCAHEWSLL